MINFREKKRLAGESRGKSSQRLGNGLFQEGANIGPLGKMTEGAGIWGAQPAARTAANLGDLQCSVESFATNVHPATGCS